MSVSHVKAYIRSMPSAEREACTELAHHIKHVCAQAGPKVAYPAICLVYAELELVLNAMEDSRITATEVAVRMKEAQ